MSNSLWAIRVYILQEILMDPKGVNTALVWTLDTLDASTEIASSIMNGTACDCIGRYTMVKLWCGWSWKGGFGRLNTTHDSCSKHLSHFSAFNRYRSVSVANLDSGQQGTRVLTALVPQFLRCPIRLLHSRQLTHLLYTILTSMNKIKYLAPKRKTKRTWSSWEALCQGYASENTETRTCATELQWRYSWEARGNGIFTPLRELVWRASTLEIAQ